MGASSYSCMSRYLTPTCATGACGREIDLGTRRHLRSFCSKTRAEEHRFHTSKAFPQADLVIRNDGSLSDLY